MRYMEPSVTPARNPSPGLEGKKVKGRMSLAQWQVVPHQREGNELQIL